MYSQDVSVPWPGAPDASWRRRSAHSPAFTHTRPSAPTQTGPMRSKDEGDRVADSNMPPKWAQNHPPEGFMGSKSTQKLTLMPNLLSDYMGYSLNLCILTQCFYSGLGAGRDEQCLVPCKESSACGARRPGAWRRPRGRSSSAAPYCRGWHPAKAQSDKK